MRCTLLVVGFLCVYSNLSAETNPSPSRYTQTQVMIEEAIFEAIDKGELDDVKRICEADPKYVHRKNFKGYTPLYWAVCRNRDSIIRHLLSKGADKDTLVKLRNITPKEGQSAYDLAKRWAKKPGDRWSRIVTDMEASTPVPYADPTDKAKSYIASQMWKPRDRIMVPIGPIGALTEMMNETSAYVYDIVLESPADGKLKRYDHIVGINGKPIAGEPQGPYHPYVIRLAEALEESQGASERKGLFSLDVIRDSKPITVSFTIEQLGYFSKTFPVKCPRSEFIYEKLCDHLMAQQKPDGSWEHRGRLYETSTAGLALMGNGNPKYIPAIRKAVDYVMKNTRTGRKPGDYSGWFLTYSGLFLGEYYLATGGENPQILEKLIEINQTLRNSQFSFGGKYRKWYDNGGYHWGHGTGSTDKNTGYLTMGAVMGPALINHALLQEAGFAVEKSHIARTIGSVSMADGDFPYDGAGAAYGRTGSGAIGLVLLNDRSEFKDKVTAWLGNDKITDGGRYFRTHYMPVSGKTWGLLGTHLINPEAYRRVMDYYKWDFIIRRAFSGDYYCPVNLQTYMYYYPSTAGKWIPWGRNSFVALSFSPLARSLRIAGGKVTILGVAEKNLSPSLLKIFRLLEANKYEAAHDALGNATGPEKSLMERYIKNKIKGIHVEMSDFMKIGDVVTTLQRAEKYTKQYGRFFQFDIESLRARKKELAIGRQFYEILERPETASAQKSIQDLKKLAHDHPTSAYAPLAKEMMYEKMMAERFPQEWIAILEDIMTRGTTPRHWDLDRYKWRYWVEAVHEFDVIFGRHADYKQRVEKLKQYFTPGVERYGFSKSKKEKENPRQTRYFEQREQRDQGTYVSRYRVGKSIRKEFGSIMQQTGLTQLILAGSGVDLKELHQLKNLKHLKHLDLANLRINEGNIKDLQPLTALEELYLSFVTDDMIAELASFNQNLTHLSLNVAKEVTDQGLQSIANFRRLTYLDLRSTGISGDGLRHLENLPLTFLGLSRTNIKSGTLGPVGKIKSLTHLDLSFTAINDKDLESLQGLKSLKFLELMRGDVSLISAMALRPVQSNPKQSNELVTERQLRRKRQLQPLPRQHWSK